MVAGPADGDGGVDGEEDEEGAAEELVEDGFAVDVGCYPSLSPLLGDEVQEVVCGAEGVGFGWFGFGGLLCWLAVHFWYDTRPILLSFSRGRALAVLTRRIAVGGGWLKVEVGEAMVLAEVLCNGALPRTDP